MARNSTESAETSFHRLRGLDALRGIAALSVVLFHFTYGYEKRFGPFHDRPWLYASYGHYGVELFFCLSGFVILGTIERTANLKRYAIARFARMYPAYFVCAAITLAVIALTGVNSGGFDNWTLGWNALMLSYLSSVKPIDPSYWTLSLEVVFYCAAAAVWSLAGKRPRMEWPSLVWLVGSLVGNLSPWLARHHRLEALMNVEYANLFVAGMMLYYLTRGDRTRWTMPTLGAALCMSVFPPEIQGGRAPQIPYVGLVMAICSAVWLVARTNGAFLDVRPLVLLGDISYSLYLIHQIVGMALIRALLGAGFNTNAAILTAVISMIGTAFCLRNLIEKPAERWIKGFGKVDARTQKTAEAVVLS